jgi:K+-sensing histidine kinase KdpD
VVNLWLMVRVPRIVAQVLGWVLAGVGPIILTALLLRTGSRQRDYVFLYVGLVAVVAILRGLWPALLTATLSFLLVDYFFVEPIGTLRIGSETDLVNLAVFAGTALVVGVLAERSLRLTRSEQQVEALQQFDRQRTELLGNVSHDLRTPLATILTEATTLLAAPTLPASSRERLEAVVDEARRLSALVADALDMTRIEGKALALQVEPVQVADAIESAAARLQRTSPRRSLTWDPDTAGVNVLADWDRLGQIFDNLLSNADRFSPADRAIDLRVEQRNGSVDILVADHGTGLPPDVREHIFERFVRGPDQPATARSGTGLGLAIVKGLVDAHHGSIAVDRSDSRGTTFRVTLPRAQD